MIFKYYCREGNVAAATSTGGITGKLPGRIGDTPLLGAGNYADNVNTAIYANFCNLCQFLQFMPIFPLCCY